MDLRRLLSLPVIGAGARTAARAVVGLLLFVAFATGQSLYSNFGAGNSFSSNGWCISGPANADCTTLATRYIAASFTSSQTLNLATISLALGNVSGTNGAIISLLNSTPNGLPGAVLESWSVSNLPGYSSLSTLTSVTSRVNPALQYGQTYWVAVQPIAADTMDIWYTNNQGLGGGMTNINQAGWTPLAGYSGQTLPAFSVTAVSGIVYRQILPQFAFGGGWYSALYFTNTTSNTVSVPVVFVADSGAPLTIPSLGASSTTVTLGPQSTTIIEAADSGSLAQGYVLTQLPNGVVAYGVFRQSVSGIAPQEAVVPLSLAGTSAATLTWDDTNYTTAVAIVNPSNSSETVTITVWDSSGILIGSSFVNLSPNGKTEAVLRSLPGLAGMSGHRGSASFAVSSGGSQSVAVLGLRFYGAAFTSIPLTAQ